MSIISGKSAPQPASS